MFKGKKAQAAAVAGRAAARGGRASNLFDKLKQGHSKFKQTKQRVKDTASKIKIEANEYMPGSAKRQERWRQNDEHKDALEGHRKDYWSGKITASELVEKRNELNQLRQANVAQSATAAAPAAQPAPQPRGFKMPSIPGKSFAAGIAGGAIGGALGAFGNEREGTTTLKHIIIAAAVWIAGWGLARGGEAPILIDLPFLIFLMLTLKIEPLLILAVVFELGSSYQGLTVVRFLPDFITNVFFNPLMPWWLIYAILKSGGKAGRISAILYVFTILLGIGLVVSTFTSIPLLSPEQTDGQISAEQVDTAAAIGGKAIGGIGTLAKNTLDGFIGGVSGFFNARIASAGGGEVFGGSAKEKQPRLGITIAPLGTVPFENSKVIKAKIEMLNPLEGQNFIRVSNVRCWHQKSKGSTEIEGDILEITNPDRVSGFRVFYDDPKTISCEFSNEDIKGISSINLAVEYDFQENVKLITYLMKDDLREDLLIRNEDPLDFISVPSGMRHPRPEYDNGPAELGIGPIELRNPPLGVKTDKHYPAFEFGIRNRKSLFNGKILKVNNIVVTMPNGVVLEALKKCGFEKTGANEYTSLYDTTKSSLQFENIDSKRLFACNMNVSPAKALGTSSHAEVEFNVDIDFTYQVKQSLRVEQR